MEEGRSVPFVELAESPHAPGIAPVLIHCREHGNGAPLVFLHGGWGYGVYPIGRQIEAFQLKRRIIAPDRSGYGRSTLVTSEMPPDFHRRAAEETLAVLDALGIERATIWGHSDGAVVAAMIGLGAPERCEQLILEAFHYFRKKPSSRGFFERFSAHPEDLAGETQRLLTEDHGEAHWHTVVRRNCRAWLRIADECAQPDGDLFDGRLGELNVPTIFLHGRSDPRTEPGELERARKELPLATMRFVEKGQHSPHSEEAAFEECNRILRELL
jgi:pimeloyl-ACP methyl ester carboxylesterase